MESPNTLIVFGASPDSYYVDHGRRHFVENMPEGFTNGAGSINIGMTPWISMSSGMTNWVWYEFTSDNFHFNGNIPQAIRDHLSGTNNQPASEFITFPDSIDPSHYCSKGKNEGAWNAVLPPPLIASITATKEKVGANFNAALTGILFGKGKTHILLFKSGFYADLDDDEFPKEAAANGAFKEHPLWKVLLQYTEGWCIERGSTLCFYDSQFFYLKFKHPGSSQVKIHWNLPPLVGAKLTQLREIAKQPQEQKELEQEEQLALNAMRMRINTQMQMNTMMSNAIAASWSASVLR